MKKITTFLVILLSALFCNTASAQTSASTILKNCADKLKAGAFTASFQIPRAESALRGDLSVSGRKFAYNTGEVSIIFNGQTQWTVDRESQDISIYNPEPAEVEQINPFAFLTGYSANYNLRLLSNDASRHTAKVELTPKTQGDISKVTVTVNTSAWQPSAFEIFTSDGSSMKVVISNLTLGANIPASRFVLKTSDYPGYEITDLR